MSDSQFQSVSTTGWDATRQFDGSLPTLPYSHLAASSTLIDKGVNVGLPYNGSAPDLGAFETGSASSSPSPSPSKSASPSPSPSASPSTAPTTPVPSGTCAAVYQTQSSWSGGHLDGQVDPGQRAVHHLAVERHTDDQRFERHGNERGL